MNEEVGLIRVDSRLLHGQVVTRWIKQVEAQQVIILDDNLAQDDFMIEVFKMAAPEGVELIVKPIDAESIQFLGTSSLKNSIILFNSIPSLIKAFQLGLPFTNVQIGGIGGGNNRTVVYKNITLTAEEYEELKHWQDQGKHIYLQTVPEDKEASLESIAKKFKS